MKEADLYNKHDKAFLEKYLASQKMELARHIKMGTDPARAMYILSKSYIEIHNKLIRLRKDKLLIKQTKEVDKQIIKEIDTCFKKRKDLKNG